MTVVVAVVQDGSVVMGADSLASNSYTKESMSGAKLFRFGPALIGSAGSIRVANVIQCMPAPEKFEASDSFVVCEYVPSVIKAMEAARVLLVKDGIARVEDSRILVAIGDRLYTISSDFGVLAHGFPYAAIGSGQEMALGVLAATEGQPAEVRIRRAIEIVAAHTPWVGGRVDILKA